MSAARGFRSLHAEWLLLGLIVAGLLATLQWMVTRGYLPQPFVHNVDDTFMDWFNTAYFAHNPGAFDVWHAVYPPLSFVFLKIFGIARCYGFSPVHARDCDVIGRATIIALYVIDLLLLYFALRRVDPRTAAVRTLAMALGLPLLFTLERGNLIVACLIPFILAHSDLSRSPVVRAVSAAATINFKPYLLFPTLAWAIKRRWRLLELAGIATLGLYTVTLALFGSGTPFQIAENLGIWVKFTTGLVWEQVYYSTSYAPVLWIDQAQFPVRDFIPQQLYDPFVFAIPLMIRATQALLLVCLLGAWVQREAVATHRLALLALLLSLVAQSPGGYTETFVLVLVFFERWERAGQAVALIAAYLISIPYDVTLGNFWQVTSDSWLTGRIADANFGLSWGVLLRPAGVLVIAWALGLDSLRLIVAAHRAARPRAGLDRSLPLSMMEAHA